MAADMHEVYPSAPLAFVTVEVRFPGETGQSVPSVVQRAFREVLGDEWVTEQLTQQEMTLGINLYALRAWASPRSCAHVRKCVPQIAG